MVEGPLGGEGSAGEGVGEDDGKEAGENYNGDYVEPVATSWGSAGFDGVESGEEGGFGEPDGERDEH